MGNVRIKQIDKINVAYVHNICFAKNKSDSTVVFLHGWGSSLDVFTPTMNALSKCYDVLSLDLPGFGESNEPDYPWRVDDFADFVVKFIESFGISSVILVGHSYGGRIAIKLASRKARGIELPFEIEKNILVDSAGILPKLTFKSRILRNKKLKDFATFILKAHGWLYPDALDNFRRRIGSKDYNAASELMRKSLVLAVNEDLTQYLPKITQPTLLFWGDKDTATPIRDAKIMEKLIPDAGLVTVSGGHFSFVENEETFIRVLYSFLCVKEYLEND